jgi:hypothetical protein
MYTLTFLANRLNVWGLLQWGILSKYLSTKFWLLGRFLEGLNEQMALLAQVNR